MYEYSGSVRLQKAILALGAMGLGLAACGGPDQGAQEQQGLGFRSITSVGPCDLAYTVVNVYPSGYWNDANSDGIVDQGEIADANIQPINGPEGAPGSGQIDPSQVGEVDDLDLGGLDTALDGVWWITDYFTLLDVGTYDVQVTIYDSDNNAIDTEIHDNVQVFEGQTTEDTFVFECDGETIQGLDIVVLVNEGPSIIDFSYDMGKFHKVCGENCMTAGFQAGTDGEEISIYWEAFPHDTSGAPLSYPGPHDNDATDTDATPLWTADDSIITGGPSEQCFVCTEPGTFDIWITAQNTTGQITQFQALAHCDDPAVGYCVDLEQTTGHQSVAAVDSEWTVNGVAVNQITSVYLSQLSYAAGTGSIAGTMAGIDYDIGDITFNGATYDLLAGTGFTGFDFPATESAGNVSSAGELRMNVAGTDGYLTIAATGLNWGIGSNVATIVAASTVLGGNEGLGNFGQNIRLNPAQGQGANATAGWAYPLCDESFAEELELTCMQTSAYFEDATGTFDVPDCATMLSEANCN